MTELTLDDFTKVMRKIVREEVAPLKERNQELRNQNAFYQSAYGDERVRREKLEEAIYSLTSRTKLLLQKQIYSDNKDKFRKLGLEVLQVVLEKELPHWDPAKEPYGIPYKRIAAHFPEHESSSIRRRLNELARHPKKLGLKGTLNPYNCSIYGFTQPPLQWKVPGFYQINPQIAEVTAH